MEFFKNAIWNIRGFFKRRTREHTAWSLQKKIIAGVMAGVVLIGGSAGAVVAYHFSDTTPQIAFSASILNPPIMAAVELYEPTYVEIPNFVGMNLASDSLEKDLTIYFKSVESKSRIEGVPFQVKLISPKNEDYLIEYLNEIDRINREIADAKEDGSENDRYEGDDLVSPNASASSESTKVAGSVHRNLQLTAEQEKAESEIEEQKAEAKDSISANFDELTIGEKLLLDKQIAIQSYATALTAVEGKNYVDDDSDGMIYINKIDSGKYIACMVPVGVYDPDAYATEVTVKEKVEYKPLDNIQDKVKENVEDEKPAEAAPQEEKFTDTVTYVDPTKTEVSGNFTEAKPATLAPSVNGSNSSSQEYQVPSARRTNNRIMAAIQNIWAMSVVHAEETPNPPGEGSTEPTPTPEPNVATATLTVPANVILYAREGLNSVSADLVSENVNSITAVSDSADVAVSVSGNKVTFTGNVAAQNDGNATITYTALCADGITQFTVQTQVTLIGSTGAIKSTDGQNLFVDKDGNVPATIANYDPNGVFYVAPTQPEYKYTGWQTIDGKTYYYNSDGVPVTGDQVIQGVQYTFNGLGVLVPKEGIDVSKWQGNIDWATASCYINFAIIRCGYRGESSRGLAIDPMFSRNVQGAKANGVKIGLYFYSTAVTEAEAVEEASLAVQCAQQAGGLSLPIYIDMEAGCQAGLSNEQRTAICNAFCATVRNSGYSAGVYASKNWLTNKINAGAISGAEIWVAQYNTTCTYSGTKKMWQYSSSGSIPGISGNVDMNRRY